MTLNGQETEVVNQNTLNHRMHDEFVAFQDIISNKDWNRQAQALEHSRAVMEVLDMAVESM